MKVAHLVSFYNSNSLYRLLFKSIDGHGVEQYVCSPRGICVQPELPHSITVRSTNLWGKLDRLLFWSKINKYEKWLDGLIHNAQPDILHAHTLYSDGFAAYKISKKYGIPYVVTVRGTDVNIFSRYFYHLRPSAREVLNNASLVIFINNITKPKLQYRLDYIFDSDKVAIVPNGMSDFWINSERPKKSSKNPEVVQVVCVARVIKLKNYHNLIEAILKLNRDDKRQYHLTIVGDYSSAYGRRMKKRYESDQIRFIGALKADDIRRYFWNSDIFAMPSRTETFGIVYIEALSQGLPVLYSKNQGLDGWDVDNNLGVSCDQHSIEDICSGIRRLADRELLPAKVVSEVKQNFSWNVLTDRLITIYKDALS